MARTPRELEGEAARTRRLRPDPDTLDGNDRKSGTAWDDPVMPRGDFDRSMSGSAQDENSPREAVPDGVAESIGRPRPKVTGRRFRLS